MLSAAVDTKTAAYGFIVIPQPLSLAILPVRLIIIKPHYGHQILLQSKFKTIF